MYGHERNKSFLSTQYELKTSHKGLKIEGNSVSCCST